ncbi:MAG: hypothetical protein ABIZ80_11000, partial [Bryobacteraceae bacterium]
SCQPEAKFTLDAALAIAGSNSYLLSARNLVIEGADDFFILSELSNLFLRSGLEGLPEDVLLTPTSDAAQAGYIATLMVGRDLDVVVLLTSAGEGEDATGGLIHRWVSRYNATVAAEVLSLGGLEDLFPEEFYLDIVRRIYKKQIAPANAKKLDLRGGGRLSRRIGRAMAENGIQFNSALVTTALRSILIRMKSADELPPETRTKAGTVLKAVTQALSKEKHFWTQPA